MQITGTLFETDPGGGTTMPIIDQPTPSNPKSPQPETQPLQPGQTTTSNPRSPSPERVNVETPDENRIDRKS
jgi:hypothetical protein